MTADAVAEVGAATDRARPLLGPPGEPPPPGPLLAPFATGYCAALAGVAPDALRLDGLALARAGRRQRELLSPDLLIVGDDDTLLPEAFGCPVVPAGAHRWSVGGPPPGLGPRDWEDLEPPDLGGSAAITAAVEAARAASGLGSVCAVPLAAPATLARHVAGGAGPQDGDEDARAALFDTCVIAVVNAVRVVLRAGVEGVVLLEDAAGGPSPVPDPTRLYGPLWRLLDHHGARAPLVVRGGSGDGPPPAQISAVVLADTPAASARDLAGATGSGAPSRLWAAGAAEHAALLAREIEAIPLDAPWVVAPLIPAGTLPERVQGFVAAVLARRERSSR